MGPHENLILEREGERRKPRGVAVQKAHFDGKRTQGGGDRRGPKGGGFCMGEKKGKI